MTIFKGEFLKKKCIWGRFLLREINFNEKGAVFSTRLFFFLIPTYYTSASTITIYNTGTLRDDIL